MKSMPKLALALMFALCVASYFDRTVISIAAPTMMKELGLSEQQMGGIMSAFLLPYALLMIPGGRLADRFGARRTLTLTLVGSGIFVALHGLASWLLLPVRALFGVTQAPLFPSFNKANSEWSAAHERSMVQAIIASGAGLGSALSPFIVTSLIGSFGWRSAFICAGAVSIVLGTVWHLLSKEQPRAAASPKADWRALISNPSLMWITAGFFALDYFEYIFFYWTYYYFEEIRKIPKTEAAIYTTALYLSWLVLTPFGGRLSDALSQRWGRIQGLRFAAMGFLGLSAVLLIAATTIQATLPAVVLICLSFAFASCADVNFWAATIEVARDQAGAAGGIMNAGGNFGGAIAPVLTPWIAARFGWDAALYFASFMAMVGVAVWLGVKPQKTAHK